MIKYQSNRQLSFAEFALPFSGSLDGNNRWVKLANLLPWDELVGIYSRNLSSGLGRPTQDLRVELGTLILQEMMDWDDRETIAQIQENPYLQYFLGYSEYRYRKVFDASLLVTIRKRLDREAVARLTAVVAERRRQLEEQSPADENNSDRDNKPSNCSGDKEAEGASGEAQVEDKSGSAHHPGDGDKADQRVERRGQLIIDATAVELEIPYPTDLGLLNEARLQSERIIDELWPFSRLGGPKPRTYRQKAKDAYLSVARKRQRSHQAIRKGIKQQLQYLRRNIKTMDALLKTVSAYMLKILLTRRDRQLIATIKLVYDQQQEMYRTQSKRIANRIVNLYQPWVRPIKRGKSGRDVEFGPKLSVSLIDGMVYVDHFSWDAFNEGNDLPAQVEAYRKRYGCYPEVVIGDTIYGNHDNRGYLKERGIRFSGRKLGRPVQETEDNRELLAAEKQQRKQEQRRRNRIEGCFGVGRRRYGLGRVRTRLAETSETSICMAFFVMSIAAFLAACFARYLKLWWRVKTAFKAIIRPMAALSGHPCAANYAVSAA